MADLYDGTTKTARHFFDAAGKPNWEILDPTTGAVQGAVKGSAKAHAARQRQPDDGGYGSVDALLLTASTGTGVYGFFPLTLFCRHLSLLWRAHVENGLLLKPS